MTTATLVLAAAVAENIVVTFLKLLLVNIYIFGQTIGPEERVYMSLK